MSDVDAVVIGGGFYGVNLASYLRRRRGLRRVVLLEREARLLARASFNNQARVHNGYHYPRSFTTAYRSRVNLPRFVSDWPDAVKSDFTKLYAVARRNSKVTPPQFVRFCKDIGAPIEPAREEFAGWFDPRLVEAVFEVQEFAFDARALAQWATGELAACDVDVRLSTSAASVHGLADLTLRVSTVADDGSSDSVDTRLVFNCTYAGLNQIAGDFGGTQTGLKQEITEMPLLALPSPLREVGVTVMDGPFFSLVPFPARDLHTFSHVRYTPHVQWVDRADVDPYRKMADYQGASRFDWMVRDVARYLPAITDARYVDSAFEVKTVLIKNEADDGRPILFEQDRALPRMYSVLGGKIDNIYDVLARLDDIAF